VDERSLNATSFVIYWWIAVPQNLTFEYLPAISTNNTWKNNTKWTESNEFRFTNLKPFTLYNVTIFVRAKGSDKVFPPYLFYEVVTNEGCEYANWS
jgi:sortilin-related receptor